MPSQRILFHHRIRGIDGQAIHVCAMHRAFLDLGHRVTEVALVPLGTRWGEPQRRRAARPWDWITRLPRPLVELAEYAYSPIGRRLLMREARREPVDFVYARYSFADAAAALACRRLDLPWVIEVNSPLAAELAATRGLLFPRLARRLERYVLRSADVVCVVSTALGEQLAESGVDPSRLLVTPNAIEPQHFATSAGQRARTRDQLAVDNDVPVLAFVGFARAWHRLDWAVDALAEPGMEHSVLVVAGEGKALAGLAERGRRLGVAARLRFLGAVPHAGVPALLAGCDIGLLPGIPEYASPLKLPEYLAAGLAVVAPDQPNLREMARPEIDALLFTADSYPDFVSALRRLVDDPGLRRQLAAHGHEGTERQARRWTDNAQRVVDRIAALGQAANANAHSVPVPSGAPLTF